MIKQPDIRPVRESGDLYKLYEDYLIDLHDFGIPSIIAIHKGFRFDGASVPRWLWSFSGLSRDGIHRPASLVHDYLYANDGRVGGAAYSRKRVDQCFNAMMMALGVADHRRKLAYFAVRVGGYFYWRG